ncbi:PROM1 protein, partial [Indicator maculatus]|nr:PROM1 protein [Indicator maculatus]
MELGNVSQPAYGPGPVAPEASTPVLVAMVHGFLQLVQPNDLPIELGSFHRDIIVMLSFFLSQFLVYELGFLVCAAIGLLFIILVPLVGCCFCCCRL